MGHVNSDDVFPMLMSHMTPQNNSPIVFAALWLVTTAMSPIDY